MGAARLLVLLLVAVALPRPAAAGDRALAELHLRAGNRRSRAGDHYGALREYQAAVAAEPHPNLYYNLGREHRLLAEAGLAGHAPLAVACYRRYLADRPDAADRANVEALIARLAARHPEPAPPLTAPVVSLPTDTPVIAASVAPAAAPLAHEVAPVHLAPPARFEQPREVAPLHLAPPAAAAHGSRRWLWIGLAAAAVTGVAVAVALALPRGPDAPPSDLGTATLHF